MCMDRRSARQAVSVVREHGWTPDLVQRASAVLARTSATLDDEDGELAAEFVRWFQHACNGDVGNAVTAINSWRPFSPATPELDELYLVLVGERASPELAARLRERCADPVKTLISVLDDVYPDDDGTSHGHRLDQAHQTAFACLLLLATSESIEYVLTRLRHFDWSASRLDSMRAEVFQPCGEAIRTATFRRWPTMPWSERTDVLRFLGGHDLLNDPLLALLTGVDFERLSPADLVEYVEGLWQFLDLRTLPQVRKILDRALQDAELEDADAKRIVQTVFTLFGDGLDGWLTEEQARRTAIVLVQHLRIGPIEIHRTRSGHWIARGPVPLAVAHELYEDAVGRRDVRVNDDLKRPPPTGSCVAWYTSDGARILPTQQEAGVEAHTGPAPVRYHDRPSEIASGFVLRYAIDTEVGLQRFEAVLRKHGIDGTLPPSWWA